jgi:predicted small metal-binding protein
MEKVLRCDCGFEARAEDERSLVERARKHALHVHGMELTDEQALELTAAAAPREQAGHEDEPERRQSK